MEAIGSGRVVSAQIEATVIRANGTREELGVVSYWHRNPLRRIWYVLGRMWRQGK